MKHPINCEKTFEESFLFWLTRFIRYKITTLSNNHIKNKEIFAGILKTLSMNISSIDELRFYMKEIRSSGILSIHVYFIPLEKLYKFLINSDLVSLTEIDEELLSDFLVSATCNLSDATKKNYKIAITTFFAYLDKNNEENRTSYHFNILLKNWGGLKGKSGTKLPVYMQKDEVYRFLNAINNYKFNDKNSNRDKLIIKIILYTGIRVSEALNIKFNDFNKDGEYYMIQVRGKGNKPRVVIIKEEIIKNELFGWLQIRNCDNNLMFCNKNGNILTQAYISRLIAEILLSTGIRKEKNGAHMLRHTFATHLYQKSKDLILVQESLGHADINTSIIYTHFDKDNLKKMTDIY